MADLSIERLNPRHDRSHFSCGQTSLDDFLRLHATQYEKRNLGRTNVAVREGEPSVLGYYTLASGVVASAEMPVKLSKKLPRHSIPVALLGRLAVDQTVQGQGLGGLLLKDALKRCLELADQIGIFAVDVLAIDDAAKCFYVRHGFVPFQDNDRHLFLPISTIAASARRGR